MFSLPILKNVHNINNTDVEASTTAKPAWVCWSLSLFKLEPPSNTHHESLKILYKTDTQQENINILILLVHMYF